MKVVALVLAMLLPHYVAPILSDTPDAYSWHFYILRGFSGTILFLLLLGMFKKNWLAVVACWMGALNEFQTSVCGITADADIVVPETSGLCIEQFGYWPYAAVAASVLVYYWRRHERES